MINTLIVSDGKNERIELILGAVVSNTKFAKFGEDVDFDKYSAIVFMVNLDQVIANEIETVKGKVEFTEFISSYKIRFHEKMIRLAVLFEGNQISKIEEAIESVKRSEIGSENYVFVNKDVEADAVISALELKEGLEVRDRQMDRESLLSEIDDLISSHNTMVLCSSAGGDIVRSTPIEYIHVNKNFYIVTEGGVKMANIMLNDNVSFSIFDEFVSMPKVRGLQAAGRASVVDMDSEEYEKILAVKNIKKESLEKLPVNLYLLKIEPTSYEYLDISLGKKGYNAKQHIEF